MTLGAQILERLEPLRLSVYKSRILTGIGMEKIVFPGQCSILSFTISSAEYSSITLPCVHISSYEKRVCQWLLLHFLLAKIAHLARPVLLSG